MIQEDYVSFKVAKLLKEKGFNNNLEECYRSYNGKETEVCKSWYKEFDYYVSNFIQRPTIQMAIKWFEKEYNLAISVVWMNGWLYGVRDMGQPYADREVLHLNEVRFETRQAAADAAILNAIQLLKNR